MKKDKIKVMYEGPIEILEIKTFYDHHGDIIWDDDGPKIYENVNVKVQLRTYMSKILDREVNKLELFIDGKEYTESYITRTKQNGNRLVIHGCIGAG